jgi:hypothetical protein
MRKRQHLQTDFIKFIVEKYSNEGQDLPDDERESPEDEPVEKKKIRKMNELEDEEEVDDDEVTVDDELIDELLNEYKRLKKKYENNRVYNRRKR